MPAEMEGAGHMPGLAGRRKAGRQSLLDVVRVQATLEATPAAVLEGTRYCSRSRRIVEQVNQRACSRPLYARRNAQPRSHRRGPVV